MYNSKIPSDAELPTSRQLLRSTLIATVAAAALLVTAVLPAEYGIDPTGIGRVLGLTQMGELKMQLSIEAEADRVGAQSPAPPAPPAAPGTGQRSGLIVPTLVSFFVGQAVAAPAGQVAQAGRSDEVTVTLRPDQAVEVKMTMKQGAKVAYVWKAEGGVVNHDTHGERPGSRSARSYKKANAVAGDEGTLEAAFDGSHGWYWRNRGKTNVTIALRINGEYEDVKRVP